MWNSWSGPMGYTSTNEDIGGLIAGTYVLNVTDMIGCTSSDTIVVNSFVGLEDITENLITISPNPVNDIVKFGIVGPFQVDLFDLFGKHLLSCNKNG